MNTDSQKAWKHPEDELSELEATIKLALELLHKGNEEDGELKPWTGEAVLQIIETIAEALSRKQDIFEETQEFEKAGEIASVVDNLGEVGAEIKDKGDVDSHVYEEVTLLLK